MSRVDVSWCVKVNCERFFVPPYFDFFFFFNSYNNHKIINRCEEFNGEAIKSLPIDGKNITEFKRYKQCLMKPFFTFYNIESELIEITEENKLNHY